MKASSEGNFYWAHVYWLSSEVVKWLKSKFKSAIKQQDARCLPLQIKVIVNYCLLIHNRRFIDFVPSTDFCKQINCDDINCSLENKVCNWLFCLQYICLALKYTSYPQKIFHRRNSRKSLANC